MVVGVVAFVVAYMFLFPTGCAAVEGMSSWEWCTTVMGNPAFSLSDWGLANQFDILIPFAVAVLAGWSHGGFSERGVRSKHDGNRMRRSMVDHPEQHDGLRTGLFGVLALAFGMLALWSSWNPGYHYLTRAAGFTVLGAGAIYLWMRQRNRHYSLAVAFGYVTAVLGIGVLVEWLAAPANKQSQSTSGSPRCWWCSCWLPLSASSSPVQVHA